MSPKEKIPRTGENPSDQAERSHKLRNVLLVGSAATVACGLAFGADIIHLGYSMSPHAEKSADGGMGVVTKVLPLEAQCLLASSTVVKNSNAKYDFKMSGLSGIPIIGNGVANISLANRTANVDVTIDDNFCNDAAEMEIDYNPKDYTYLIKVPGDKVYAQSSPNFAAVDSATSTKFKYTPGGSTLNGVVAAAQSFVNSSFFNRVPGISNVAGTLNGTDSALLAGALLAAQNTADNVCGKQVVQAASETYLADAVAVAKQYAEPVRDGYSGHEITYKAEFVKADMKTPYNLADLAIRGASNEGLAAFLKGDGASVENGALTTGQCKFSDKVAAQVKAQNNTGNTVASGAKG